MNTEKIFIKALPIKYVNNKARQYCEVQCPDCLKLHECRLDSFKRSETTCCRSCLNKRRLKRSKEELFNHIDFYRSPSGKASVIYTNQIIRSKQRGYQLPKYTREEFIEFLLNSNEYIILFENWKNSNFKKNKAPSVDRIDDYKTYSFDNIQIITWEQNNEKYKADTLAGKSIKTCRAVDQLSLEGVFIKRFHSISEANRETNADIGKIVSMCKNKPYKYIINKHGIKKAVYAKSIKGFKWRYSSIPNKKDEHI